MRGQNPAILRYLREHGSITPMEAINYLGILRLSGRILELRQAGYRIRTDRYTTGGGAVVARYVLEEQLTLGVA